MTTKTTTRRAILVSAAALPALAAPAVAIPTAETDPIFAAIEDHRRKYAHYNAVHDREEALEDAIPDEKRKAYHVADRGTDEGANDDPRWTAYQSDYWAASDAEEEAAVNLLNVQPTTLAGVSALLMYAHDQEAGGYQWPDVELDGAPTARGWHTFLFAHVADAIDGIAVRS